IVTDDLNYEQWPPNVKTRLVENGVWDVVVNGVPPDPTKIPELAATTNSIEPGTDKEEKNDYATVLLFQSVPENLILQIGEQSSPKDMWEALKTINLGADRVREARLQTLMNDFERLKMSDSESIDTFSGKLSELASKLASLGQSIEEPKLVRKLLNSLPRSKFIMLVASLEQMLDLNAIKYEDVVDLMIRTREDKVEEIIEDMAEATEEEDKKGHFKSVCPEKKEENQELNKTETEVADTVLYMHEVVFLNEEKVIPRALETSKKEEGIWYLDNGASNHMTGERGYFSELNQNIKGKVKFGDGSCVYIDGKGSILIVMKGVRKMIIKNLLFVPRLNRNVLSVAQMTSRGYTVIMGAGECIIKDETGIVFDRAIWEERGIGLRLQMIEGTLTS
ncbi:unnamed protein product, partial [Brassica oleracea]